jgi:hypothetical protein
VLSWWLETGPYRGRRAAEPAGGRRQNVRLGIALALVAGLSLAVCSSVANAFTLPVTGPPAAPRMVFNNQMKVVPVCLPVTNPAAGQQSCLASSHPASVRGSPDKSSSP